MAEPHLGHHQHGPALGLLPFLPHPEPQVGPPPGEVQVEDLGLRGLQGGVIGDGVACKVRVFIRVYSNDSKNGGQGVQRGCG